MLEQRIRPALNCTEWENAFAEYEVARIAENAFDFGPYADAQYRAEQQGPMALFDERLTDISDRLSDITCRAKRRLLQLVPDTPAGLLWQIEQLLDTSTELGTPPWSEAEVRPVLTAARQLLSGEFTRQQVSA